MARFHFQVRTPTHVLVVEGIDLPNPNEARLEAARRVGELLKTHAELLWADEEWRMDVTDEKGLILFVLTITAARTAATLGTSMSK